MKIKPKVQACMEDTFNKSRRYVQQCAMGYNVNDDANKMIVTSTNGCHKNNSKQRLAQIFNLYGELNCSRKLAATIVKQRSQKPFRRVSDLIEAAKPFCPPQREKKELAKVLNTSVEYIVTGTTSVAEKPQTNKEQNETKN